MQTGACTQKQTHKELPPVWVGGVATQQLSEAAYGCSNWVEQHSWRTPVQDLASGNQPHNPQPYSAHSARGPSPGGGGVFQWGLQWNFIHQQCFATSESRSEIWGLIYEARSLFKSASTTLLVSVQVSSNFIHQLGSQRVNSVNSPSARDHMCWWISRYWLYVPNLSLVLRSDTQKRFTCDRWHWLNLWWPSQLLLLSLAGGLLKEAAVRATSFLSELWVSKCVCVFGKGSSRASSSFFFLVWKPFFDLSTVIGSSWNPHPYGIFQKTIGLNWSLWQRCSHPFLVSLSATSVLQAMYSSKTEPTCKHCQSSW